MFDRNPYVDHLLMFNPLKQTFSQLTQEIRAMGFDLVIDLHGNMRSFLVRLVTGAPKTVRVEKNSFARWFLVVFKQSSASLKKSVREKILECLPPLDIPLASTDTQLYPMHPGGVLSSLSIDPAARLIGLAPGAKHATKRWKPEFFAQVANQLGQRTKSMILILGDKSDQAVADQVSRLVTVPHKNLAGWTNLNELMAVVSTLSLLVTNDSGLMHMGEALKIPLVALFGPTVREFGFAPYRDSSRLLECADLSCRPCSLHGEDRCPLQHHRCMEQLRPEPVLSAAENLLKRSALS